MQLEKYQDSWALVTGASSGIGKEFAFELAKKKINLVLLARREELLNEIAIELKETFKIEVKFIKFDLNNISEIDKVYEFCKDIKIEILINNAGFGKLSELNSMPQKKIVEMINVNCTAPSLLTKYFTEKMKQERRGNVVFLGSILAYFPTPMMGLYSATKVFNAFLGESLMFELEKYNIKSFVLNPGSTDTDFHRVADNNRGVNVRRPDQVVKSFFKSGNPVFDDGVTNRFLISLKRILPRRITYFLMKQFIRRNNNL